MGLNLIYDNGCGFKVESAGIEPTQYEINTMTASDWVEEELGKTEKAALDPAYQLLNEVLAYRAALKEYRANNYQGERPALEI